MTTYSVHLRNQIFVKGSGFLSFAKNMGRNIGNDISKSLSDAVRNFLIMLNNLLQMHLKLLQKERFKNQQKKIVISLELKLQIKSQKLHLRKIQKNLQM